MAYILHNNSYKYKERYSSFCLYIEPYCLIIVILGNELCTSASLNNGITSRFKSCNEVTRLTPFVLYNIAFFKWSFPPPPLSSMYSATTHNIHHYSQAPSLTIYKKERKADVTSPFCWLTSFSWVFLCGEMSSTCRKCNHS